MLGGVAADRREREVVGIPPVDSRHSIGNVVAVIVDDARRGSLIADGEQAKRFRRLGQAFVGKDVDVPRMGNRHELEPIGKQRFLELVGHPKVIASVLRLQLVAADAHVLDRIGLVVPGGPFPVTHFAAAHEIGDELEAMAIPCEEKRTR